MKLKRISAIFAAIIAVFVLSACNIQTPGLSMQDISLSDNAAISIDEGGIYDSKNEVSLYIHVYKHLPKNYITKKEAKALGWTGGTLYELAPGKCIGGDVFGNYEELLPEKKNRTYRECDIDTLCKKSRGKKRIIYSDDGLIYYTADHYESFELLYGDEE